MPFIGGTITYREPGLLRICNDLLHVPVPQRAKQTEEEISFRQSPRQLFLCWEVLDQQLILHCILVKVFDGDILLAGHLHSIHIILLEERLGLTEDITHEAHLGSLYRWKKHVHYSMSHHYEKHLPC